MTYDGWLLVPSPIDKPNKSCRIEEPGAVLTEGAKDALDETFKEIEKEIPLGRLADPMDVAYAAVFLATVNPIN